MWQNLKYYYNIYFDYNINETHGDLNLTLKKTKSFEVNKLSFQEKNFCHILDSQFTIKCIYFDNSFYFNLKYNIDLENFVTSGYYSSHFYDLDLSNIASSKSDKNNYLVCPLYKGKCYNWCYYLYYNYTYCRLCDENYDYPNCPIISI